MYETIGMFAVGAIIICIIIFYSNREAEKSKSLQQEFEYYKKHSWIFSRQCNNLYWPRNKESIKELLKKSYGDREIEEEIAKSLDSFKKNEERLKAKNLIVFNNLELFDTFFVNDFEKILKAKFREKLKNIFVSEEKSNKWLQELVEYSILREEGECYKLNIILIEHPYKTDKYGRQLYTTFEEYKKFSNKKDWV